MRLIVDRFIERAYLRMYYSNMRLPRPITVKHVASPKGIADEKDGRAIKALFQPVEWKPANGVGRDRWIEMMSKITRVEAVMVNLVPRVRRVDAIQSFVSQETPIIRIHDADGMCRHRLQLHDRHRRPLGDEVDRAYARPALIGATPPWSSKFGATCCSSPMRRRSAPSPSIAMAAIDTALWDLRCRKAGLPLHVMAGGAQDRVRLYTTEGGWLHLEAEALVEDALRQKAAGFGGAKLKVGRALHEDVARIGAVRAAGRSESLKFLPMPTRPLPLMRRSGGRGAMRSSTSAGWRSRCRPTISTAIYGCRAPPAFRSQSAKAFIARSTFGEYLQRGACSVVQVDVGRIGGITPWLKVAHLAECFNVAVSPHFLMEIHVALCAAVPNARWVEYIPQLESLTTEGMTIKDGYAVPSCEAGLGIAWDWAAIDRQVADGSRFTLV